MGRLLREHYWIPALVSSQLVADGPPDPFAVARAQLCRLPGDRRAGRVLRRRVPAPRDVVGAGARSRSAVSVVSSTAGRSMCRVRSSTSRRTAPTPMPSPPRCPSHHRRSRRRHDLGLARLGAPPTVPAAAVHHPRPACVGHDHQGYCNWLQASSTLDSAHISTLHSAYVARSIRMRWRSGTAHESSHRVRLRRVRAASPARGGTYLRTTKWVFPFVSLCPAAPGARSSSPHRSTTTITISSSARWSTTSPICTTVSPIPQ